MSTLSGEEILAGIRKAKALLAEHGAVPSQVEITTAQYEALKKHCERMGVKETSAENSILGLKIVINDNLQR